MAAPERPGARVFTIEPQLGGDTIPQSPWNRDGDTDKFIPMGAVIAAGQTAPFHVDFDVESWIVSVMPAAGVFVQVYPGPGATGPGFPGAGGAKGRIPGAGPDLQIRNVGAVSATVVAIATRGYKWLTWECGTLA